MKTMLIARENDGIDLFAETTTGTSNIDTGR